MTPEARRLDTLAAAQIIADAEVAHCWELVRVGIQMLFIGTGNLGELICHLRAGNGMTLDELTVEIDPPGSDRVLVGILRDQRTCSAPRLIDELERLAGRAGAASPASSADGRPGSGGTPAGTPPSSAGGAEAPDLLGLLTGLLGTTPERLAGDLAAPLDVAACWSPCRRQCAPNSIVSRCCKTSHPRPGRSTTCTAAAARRTHCHGRNRLRASGTDGSGPDQVATTNPSYPLLATSAQRRA